MFGKRGVFNIIWVLFLTLVAQAWSVEAPKSLTTANFEEVKSYVAGGEQRFLDVDWKISVFDGYNAAQQEDKPILLWLYFGGPMGNC